MTNKSWWVTWCELLLANWKTLSSFSQSSYISSRLGFVLCLTILWSSAILVDHCLYGDSSSNCKQSNATEVIVIMGCEYRVHWKGFISYIYNILLFYAAVLWFRKWNMKWFPATEAKDWGSVILITLAHGFKVCLHRLPTEWLQTLLWLGGDQCSSTQ